MQNRPDGKGFRPDFTRVFLQDYACRIAFFLHLLLIFQRMVSIMEHEKAIRCIRQGRKFPFGPVKMQEA